MMFKFYTVSFGVQFILFLVSNYSFVVYIWVMSNHERWELNGKQDEGYQIVYISEALFFVIFSIDYFARVCVVNFSSHAYSLNGFLDVISILSFIGFIDLKIMDYIGYCRFVRLLKFSRLLKLFFSRILGKEVDELMLQISILVSSIAVFFLLTAGVLHALHIYEHSSAFDSTVGRHLSYFDFIYFVVVCSTTVGLGDIYPVTSTARGLTMMAILIGFTIIPLQVTALASVIGKHSREQYRSKVHVPSRNTKLSYSRMHVCICGLVDYTLLARFLEELFNLSHSSEYRCSSLPFPSLPFPSLSFPFPSQSIYFSHSIFSLQSTTINPPLSHTTIH